MSWLKELLHSGSFRFAMPGPPPAAPAPTALELELLGRLRVAAIKSPKTEATHG